MRAFLREHPDAGYMSRPMVEREMTVDDDLAMARIDDRYLPALMMVFALVNAEAVDPEARRWLIAHAMRTAYLRGLVDGLVRDVP